MVKKNADSLCNCRPWRRLRFDPRKFPIDDVTIERSIFCPWLVAAWFLIFALGNDQSEDTIAISSFEKRKFVSICTKTRTNSCGSFRELICLVINLGFLNIFMYFCFIFRLLLRPLASFVISGCRGYFTPLCSPLLLYFIKQELIANIDIPIDVLWILPMVVFPFQLIADNCNLHALSQEM